MSSISVDYDVLNQKGSPAWYSDTFANIPTPGYKGRMFISTDTFAFYRDNGTGWDLVGGPGTGTITGAGVSGQVTYFIGTDTIGGNNNLFYDITNSRLGIGTATPGAPLDIHSTGTAAQFNGTGVNNSFVLFQNAGSSKWRIGNLYNSGANDYQIFDVTNSTARLTIKNTGASTLIGTFTATSLIKSGGTNLQILLADGSTTPTSTFGAGSVTNVSALTLGTTGTDLTSSVVNSTTTPVITLNVPTASATNRGALSSADWTTFNNKQATLSLTTIGTSGAATLVGATLNIPNYTNVGTVTSVAALTLGTTGTDLSSSVANSTTTPVITLNVPTASATNRGALSSADWTIFNNKQATISVTAPVVLTGATISMPAATTSVNGYLTSTDWNTFNNKTSNLGTVTDVVALTIGTTGIDITSTAVTTTTTPVITLNIPTASASNRGALSSTDWTIFNNKQATLSLTTTGTSGAATLVANTLNVPNYGSALSGYLPLSGGTLTGALGGTSATFSGNLTTNSGINYFNGASDSVLYYQIGGITGGHLYLTSTKLELNAYSTRNIVFETNGVTRLTIASNGVATFSNYILNDNSILIKTGFNTSTSGYTGIGAVATGLTINLGTGTTGSLLFNTGASYSYTFPAATGTLALTSDLGSYLPLSGGALTGALSITTNTSPSLNIVKDATLDNRYIRFTNSQASSKNWDIINQTNASNNELWLYESTTPVAALKLASITGAATFSSTGAFGGSASTPVTLAINSANSNCDITIQSSNSSSVSRIRNGTNDLQFHTNGTLSLTLASNQAATFSGSVLSGEYKIAPNGTNAVYNIVNSDQTYAGQYNIQAGGGSAGYGGAFIMYGHSHSTKPGYVVAGISAGSLGKFTVNNQANGLGTELFSIDVNGLATLTNGLTATSGIFSSTLQTNATLTIGNQFVSGNYILQITPSTSTAVQLQGILAGTGTAPLVLQPSGDNVGINTSSPTVQLDITGKDNGGTSLFAKVFSNNRSVFTGIGYQRLETNGDLSIVAGSTTNFINSGTTRYTITSAGINNYTSRGNYLGSTDNSLFSLNSGGTLYTVGFSPTATANSSNTLTLTTGQTTWIYTGSGTATWTLPNPSGTNQMFWIKNAGTGIITLNAYSGTNIINNAAASVSSITIAIGATALIQQDGNVKSYQLQ